MFQLNYKKAHNIGLWNILTLYVHCTNYFGLYSICAMLILGLVMAVKLYESRADF